MEIRTRTWTGTFVAVLTGAAGLLTPLPSHASQLLLPKVPLFINVSTTPNIFLQMDDSGSMDWDIMMPTHFTTCRYNSKKNCDQLESTGEFYDWTGEVDNRNRRIYATFEYVETSDDDAYNTGCYNADREVIELCDARSTGTAPWDWRVKSSALNVLFFSPDVQYNPWPGYSNASFTSARSYPDNSQSGYSDTDNLSGFTYNFWIDDKGFVGGQPDKTDSTNGSNGIVDEWDSYVQVAVTSTSYTCTLYTHSPNSNGLNSQVSTLQSTDSRCQAALGTNTTSAQLRQNIANWFQYYRRRAMVARAAVGRVVTDLPAFRYGFGVINDESLFVQMPGATVNDYTEHNQNLIEEYIDHEQQPLGTPLRRGLERVGRYYKGDLSGKPSPIIRACQKNFTVLFSDGYWNGPNPVVVKTDVDKDNGVVYQGTSAETKVLLADVAKYYYDLDLSTMPDLVPTDQFDSANHQHMVTFTIGFGITGSLYDSDGDGWPNNLNNGAKWYTTDATDNEKVVDDMWHAAWNSRGRYISAKRPETLITELSDAILDISDRVGGAASGATNGGSISTESKVFQAKFDAADWHGSLLAIEVDPVTGELDTTAWEAGAILNTKSNGWFLSDRKMFTFDSQSNAGRNFTWSGLSTAQQALMAKHPSSGNTDSNGEARVKFIRGSKTDEGGLFRVRAHRLGDIGHSDPKYVGIPPFFYSFGNYQTFAINNKDRPAVIYVGGNDGMLHAFRESDGEEIFAYVPNEIIHKLPQLTSPYYNHEFYVDGPPEYGDVQISDAWKSVLVGSLRSGGQGIFALDITDPENFDSTKVLWEFTDDNDVDLGYFFGEPQIRKMANDKWAVVITSGYNNQENDGRVSTTGKNYVYVLFIEAGINGWSGSDYRKIEIAGANGLSAPAVADVDGDQLADFIYVGDLDGNMWKVDVTSSTPSSWHVSFGGEPLFIAKNEDDERQPITNRPAIMRHPLSIQEGVLVLFGTGKYIEVNDDVLEGVPTQSVYGIWDRDGYYNKASSLRNDYGAHLFSRSELNKPELTLDSTTNNRIIHDYAENFPLWFDEEGEPSARGWAVDLPIEGERIIRKIILRDDIAFLVTLIPDEDVCAAGGTGWLMALNAQTGSAPRFPVLDITDDNVIDSQDILMRENPHNGEGSDPAVTTPVGIEMLSIPNLPALLYDDRASDLGGVFPPRANAPRGCGAEGAKSFTYTTRTNGSIQMVAAAHQPLSCGRQSWDQTH